MMSKKFLQDTPLGFLYSVYVTGQNYMEVQVKNF